MNKLNQISLLIIVCFFFSCKEETKYNDPISTSIISDSIPQNGVFYSKTKFTFTLIELKNGNYRYWYYGDVRGVENNSPIIGTYTIENNKIILDKKDVFQKIWSFRKIDKQLSLWSDEAIEYYKNETKLHYMGIIRSTATPIVDLLKQTKA